MSIKTQENLKGDADQQRRQALAKETVDRILKDTPRHISTEMYARTVAFEAYAEGWNNKALDVKDEIDRLKSELASLKSMVGFDRSAVLTMIRAVKEGDMEKFDRYARFGAEKTDDERFQKTVDRFLNGEFGSLVFAAAIDGGKE